MSPLIKVNRSNEFHHPVITGGRHAFANAKIDYGFTHFGIHDQIGRIGLLGDAIESLHGDVVGVVFNFKIQVLGEVISNLGWRWKTHRTGLIERDIHARIDSQTLALQLQGHNRCEFIKRGGIATNILDIVNFIFNPVMPKSRFSLGGDVHVADFAAIDIGGVVVAA